MSDASYRYVAVDRTGRRVSGVIEAASETGAFQVLKGRDLSPIRLAVARGAGAREPMRSGRLSDQALAAFLADLGVLLGAGTDIRSALRVLGDRQAGAGASGLAGALNREVSGGLGLDEALGRHLDRDRAFIAALIGAGEAAGDLSGGFRRAAHMIEQRLRLRDQLTSALAYPLFVLASTILAVLVILLFVVPSLAPLVGDSQHAPPMSLAVLLFASNLLQRHLMALGIGSAITVVGLMIAGRLGLLTRPWERVLLDGLWRRTVSGFVYGAYAIELGAMLQAGAPIGDALRLAARSVGLGLARERLESAWAKVRSGETLPAALAGVGGFPAAIARLAAVGDASGALGEMIARGGSLEENAAVRRIESWSRVLGPALIVILGALIGGLFAALLSGVETLGSVTGE